MTPALIQVEWLAAGHCLNIEAISRRGAPWRVARYPAGFALLRHPDHGPALFDTGYSPRALAAMRRWPGLLYGLITPVRLDPAQSAAAQLARRGVAPADVRQVIVSHFHADHVGGLRDFPNARLRFAPEAYAAVRPLRGLRAVRRAHLPELLPPDFAARADPLPPLPAWLAAGPDLAPFERAHDLFSDGSAWAVPLPGHAHGQIGLVVRTLAGRVFLAADAAWSLLALQTGAGPHPLAKAAFADPVAERRTFDRVRAFMQAHPDVRVYPSHDPDLAPC